MIEMIFRSTFFAIIIQRMTTKKRNTILAVARGEIGQTEQPPGTNKTKYGQWYGLDGYAWCAMFVSWVYHKAGIPLGHIDDASGFRYCPSAYQFWKRSGEVTTSPRPADIVLFDWEGDGRSDHTGIFVKDNGDGKTFTSIEGNTSYSSNSNGGQVMERKRYYASVRAFVSPGVLKNEGASVLKPEYVPGDVNAGVAEFQKKLHDLGYRIVVDGIFGSETLRAVKQFQGDQHLAPTGKVTVVLLEVMETVLLGSRLPASQLTTGSFLNPGSSGMAVRLLQEKLNKVGADPILFVDGVYGPETKRAVIDFQRLNDLETDGIAGPVTLKKLGLVV
jgi:peptidoglycan hydrolase-like protein with peptidoglycan-binding domain